MPPEEVIEQTPPPAAVPAAVVEETPKPVTLAETEAKLRQDFDKLHGRDVTKMVGYKKPEEKKVEPTPPVAAPVPATPVVDETARAEEKERKTRAARRNAKLIAMQTKIDTLESIISGRQAPPAAPASKTVETELKEPLREAYATAEEWFKAVREFDKKQTEADLKKAQEMAERKTQEDEAVQSIQEFNKRLNEAKVKHDDWDEVTEATTVQFNPILQGLLMAADPELLYEYAKAPKEAKRLNILNEVAVVAAGNSDDITSTLRFLSKHPDVIEELNELSPIKAAKFIGKLEARIEAESKAASPKGDPPNPPIPASGPQKGEPKGEPARREPAPKPKPEPPPVLNGAPPASDDWRSPENMSIKEREARMMQDPNYAVRRR